LQRETGVTKKTGSKKIRRARNRSEAFEEGQAALLKSRNDELFRPREKSGGDASSLLANIKSKKGRKG